MLLIKLNEKRPNLMSWSYNEWSVHYPEVHTFFISYI